ncbi:MAG: outer membrane beta-barrel protein [Rhizobiales bacterium]|nr:outer membrane beta-barrel protein [Hyphomicrobiales bacterium]
MSRHSILKAALTLCVVTGVTGAALAEEATTDQRGVSVKERARPDYDAAGIRAGSFMVYPTASVSEIYDDNIYAVDTGETDDFITKLASSVAVNSNWNRHALNLNAGLSQLLYADNTDEDNFNWNIGGSARLDILRDTNVSVNAGFAQAHEDRGSPSSPGLAAEPTEYFTTDAGVTFFQRFNRLFGELGATYMKYDYKDVDAVGGGTINQDQRDRNEYTQSLKLGYSVSPDTSLYIRGTLNQRDYRLRPPSVGITVDRNSNGYEVVGGSDFKISNIMQGGVYVGYHEQDYEAVGLSNASGVAFGADVDWFITPLTTINLNASSSIQETTTAGASGYQSMGVGLTVDHELLRNVILSGNVGYSNDDYDTISRQDDYISAGLGVDYLLNRNFELGLKYDYKDRNSDIVGNDYSRNQLGLTLTGKL